jgi:hypothetical protein
MLIKTGSLAIFRKKMGILDDTEIEVVPGDVQGQYVEAYHMITGSFCGVRYRIGIKWLEEHYPQEFKEVLIERLIRPHKP